MNIARKSRTLELRLAPQLRFPQANGRGCRSGHAQRACRSPGLRRVFLTHTITLLAAHSLRSTTLRCHACCSYLCRPLPGLSNTHTHYNDRLAASRAGFPGLAAHFRWPLSTWSVTHPSRLVFRVRFPRRVCLHATVADRVSFRYTLGFWMDVAFPQQ